MTQFFTDFSNDIIGQLPANTSLRRLADTDDYQVVLEGGVKQLRYYVPSGIQKARGLSFDAVEQSGTTEIFATLRDVDPGNPNTCRVLLSGNDSPDTDYEAYLLSSPTKRFSILRRFNGTVDIAAMPNPATPMPSRNDYYHMRLRVEDADADYRLHAKYWLEGTDEPDYWLLTIRDITNPRTGWMGLLGFVVRATVYYKNVGIGTDGDPAPTEPVSTTVTADLNVTLDNVDFVSLQRALISLNSELDFESISFESVTNINQTLFTQIALDDVELSSYIGIEEFVIITSDNTLDSLEFDSTYDVSLNFDSIIHLDNLQLLSFVEINFKGVWFNPLIEGQSWLDQRERRTSWSGTTRPYNVHPYGSVVPLAVDAFGAISDVVINDLETSLTRITKWTEL